jgi:hypothetical protein
LLDLGVDPVCVDRRIKLERAPEIFRARFIMDQRSLHNGKRTPTDNRELIAQAMFAAEKTLDTLTDAAYRSAFEGVPFQQRVTHPGSHGFPDATFDYLFGKNVRLGKPIIIQTNVSDHLHVSCDVVIQ